MLDRAQIIKTATGWDNNLAMNNGRSLINKLQINTQWQTHLENHLRKYLFFSSSKGKGHEKRPQDAATAVRPTWRLLAVLEKR